MLLGQAGWRSALPEPSDGESRSSGKLRLLLTIYLVLTGPVGDGTCGMQASFHDLLRGYGLDGDVGNQVERVETCLLALGAFLDARSCIFALHREWLTSWVCRRVRVCVACGRAGGAHTNIDTGCGASPGPPARAWRT